MESISTAKLKDNDPAARIGVYHCNFLLKTLMRQIASGVTVLSFMRGSKLSIHPEISVYARVCKLCSGSVS